MLLKPGGDSSAIIVSTERMRKTESERARTRCYTPRIPMRWEIFGWRCPTSSLQQKGMIQIPLPQLVCPDTDDVVYDELDPIDINTPARKN